MKRCSTARWLGSRLTNLTPRLSSFYWTWKAISRQEKLYRLFQEPTRKAPEIPTSSALLYCYVIAVTYWRRFHMSKQYFYNKLLWFNWSSGVSEYSQSTISQWVFRAPVTDIYTFFKLFYRAYGFSTGYKRLCVTQFCILALTYESSVYINHSFTIFYLVHSCIFRNHLKCLYKATHGLTRSKIAPSSITIGKVGTNLRRWKHIPPPSPHQPLNRPKYFMISLWANLRDGSEKYKKTRKIPKLGFPKEKVR